MLRYAILVAWCCLIQVQASEESPRIIIVGAGASGFAAATRLLQNGFDNITILEAENRIGGRIHTTEFGGYQVDMGAQWVHGVEGNEAFEMAWPLGLIEHSVPSDARIYSSSGVISEDTSEELLELNDNITTSKIPEEYNNRSAGDYFKIKFDEYFDAHPELTAERNSLITMFDMMLAANTAADTWYNISPSSSYVPCKGDTEVNWKDKGYSTIFDILMKKLPNPAEELPVMNKTILNAEVSRINYDVPGGGVRVVTANGDEYTADHVIVTPSVGVLQADYQTMFDPQLPEAKIKAIKRLTLGSVVKLYLLYEEPWWDGENGITLHWSEKDRTEIANDPEKSWLLGLVDMSGVAHKPRLLLCWITGPHAREMDNVPDERIFSQMKEVLQRFFGTSYNLTEPTAIMWSQWYTNKHFRGTWSYQSPEFVNSDSKVTDLSDPIMKDGKPAVMFAGEVTHPTHYSTVQGAIGSGWREADRLIKLYSDEKATKKS